MTSSSDAAGSRGASPATGTNTLLPTPPACLGSPPVAESLSAESALSLDAMGQSVEQGECVVGSGGTEQDLVPPVGHRKGLIGLLVRNLLRRLTPPLSGRGGRSIRAANTSAGRADRTSI